MKKKYFIGLAVICAAFLYLVWASFSKSFQFALTPGEFLASGSDYLGKAVKISGTVAEGSLSAAGLEHHFMITDGRHAVSVHYRGMVPNTFREGADVVATGRFDPEANIFEASQILTKCSSKYEVGR